MILRNGVDVVSLARFERALQRATGGRLVQRLFTPAEIALCAGRVESLAVRFAAKEAVAKALGVGLGALALHDMEVLHDARGAPLLQLHGTALARATALGLTDWSLSLSHDGGVALAFVTFWG